MSNNDYYVREILNIVEIKKKKNRQKKAVILSSIAAFFMVTILLIYSIFAEEKWVDLLEEKTTGREYLYFEIEHNMTTAKYKYYGYGYTISLRDRSTGEFIYMDNGVDRGYQVFMPNNMFDSTFVGNTEKVKIYIYDLLKITNVKEEYFWSNNLTVYLNARIGIKVDGKLMRLYDSLEGDVVFGMPNGHKTGSYKTAEDGSAPINGDGLGIKNAIEHYYGTSWSQATQKNLGLNFNLHYDLEASAKYDGLFVEYKYNGERIGYEPIRQFDKEQKNFNVEFLIPSGFLYNGKYEKGTFYNKSMVSGNGNNITVDIKKASSTYSPKCHHIVINCDKLPSTGTPVDVDVEYRLNSKTGEELQSKKTIKGYVNTQFNLTADKINGYVCKKYIMIGQTEHEADNPAVSAKLNSEKWNTPVNGKLKVIFIYEEEPVKVVPKCQPRAYGNDKSATIYLKKSTFNSLNQITVNNITFDFDNIVVGQDKNRLPVEGTHRFEWFDFYIDSDKSNIDAVYHIPYQSYTHSFNIPKSEFVKTSIEGQPEVWKAANLQIDYAIRCECTGYGFSLDHPLNIYVNIIENKPPVAMFKAQTEVNLIDESIRIIDDVYINQVSTIDNRATDPNGDDDIDYIIYSLVDSNKNSYTLKMTKDRGNLIYYVDSHNIEANNIEFNGINEYGDLKLIFKTDEVWTITQYVKDIEGLNDTYTNTVKASELSLDPIARITDLFTYRFPYGVEFGGKQTRIIGLSSSTSDVASFLKGTGVYVDHDKDNMEIIPLNGQSIDSIFFENDIVIEKENNVLKINNVSMSTLKLMFKEYGQYKIRLQVTDTEGRVSKWSEQIITIVEDTEPIINIPLADKYYRNSLGFSDINIYVEASSNDNDIIETYDVKYKFDSNNDNNFDDEEFTSTGLTSSDVNIEGIIYKHVKIKVDKLGKYKLYVTCKDKFGQPTILKYINDIDYKKSNANKIFELDNYAPRFTFDTEKNDTNLDIKLTYSKLTGTKEVDLLNNLDYLKNELTVNVGDTNLNSYKLGVLKNGLTETIKWKKVLMNGLNPTNQFYYIDKAHTTHTANNTSVFGCCLELLSSGTYASGWNGIPISSFYMADFATATAHQRDFHQYIGSVKNEAGNVGGLMVYTGRDYLQIRGSNTNIIVGNHGTRDYFGVSGYRASSYTAITEKDYYNYDIKFDMPYLARSNYGDVGHHNYKFLFNIKNDSNYYYISQNERVWQEWVGVTIYRREALDSYLYKVVNGKHFLLKTFTAGGDLVHVEYEWDNEWDTEPSGVNYVKGYYRVGGISTNGNTLKVYDNIDRLLFTYSMKDEEKGGKFGLTGSNAPTAELKIKSLNYTENANIVDTIREFSGNEKYLISILENNEVEELKNATALNYLIKDLTAKDITPVFVGVTGVNDTKLKQIIQKVGRGKFIELNNVRTNLTDVSQYISSDIALKKPNNDYILVDENINYVEKYTDIENDKMYYKAYKYTHNPYYFENSNQLIGNNNIWIDEGITNFTLTGKYTVQAIAQDNPFYPNINGNHLFKNYRKTSESYTKDIYVHRKPYAIFKVDNSFKDEALPKTSIIEDLADTNYNFNIKGKYHTYIRNAGGQPYDNTRDYNVINNNSISLNSYYSSNYDWEEHQSNIYKYEVYSDVELNIPEDAINAVLYFNYTTASTRDNYLVVRENYNNATSVRDSGTGALAITGRGNVNINMQCTATIPPTWDDVDEISFSAKVTSMTLVYYQKRTNVTVPIIENSYDLDHKSEANKGITEWEWKLLYENGNVLKQNFANRLEGITWVQNNLKGAWENTTIFLRVKDKEGVWSDTVTSYLDEDVIHDPNQDNNNIYFKPIADFMIVNNPLILNKETQQIIDKSFDLQGLEITSYWNVYKDDIQIATTIKGDINNYLNQKIKELGVGKYTLELKVVNSRGLESDLLKKSFDVIEVNIDMRAKLKTELPIFNLSSVPASENLIAYDIYTNYLFNLKLQLALYQNGVQVSPTNTVKYSSDVASKIGNEIYWNDILYNIPATLKNGDYIMNISAVDVDRPKAFKEILFNVKVRTPINLQPILDNELRAGKVTNIRANTSKYVNSSYSVVENTTYPNKNKSGVTVILFYGTSYATDPLLLNGDNTNWSSSTTLSKSIPAGNYTARFIATLPSGDFEYKDVTYKFIVNTPPVITDSEIYAELGGSYIYENDDVNFRLRYHDVDLSSLTVNVKLYKSSNLSTPIKSYTKIVSPNGSSYDDYIVRLIDDIPLGDYRVVATVTDDYDESAAITKDFTANDLWINGKVTHTVDWEKNRQTYNAKYPSKTRSNDTYWNGESLETSANTTIINSNSNVVCNKVSVEVINNDKPLDKHFLQWLKSDNTTNDKWSLSYWDKDWVRKDGYVITKWGADKKQELILRFKAYFNNDWVETFDVKIYIDNREDYWKLHRAW